MSKLIGTNANQVPSNADLGTAAFMDVKDFLTSSGSDLATVNAVINSTTLDAFIYDTTKDSDGGAWRHRCESLSWYNERLNTQTRGSRKEFPQIAVIIVESSVITIYDADDVTLPMWMVIDQNIRLNSGQAHYATGYFEGVRVYNSAAMLNGELVFTCGSDGSTGAYSWVMRYSFLSDRIRRYNGAGSTGYGRVSGDFIYDIARRHNSSGSSYTGFTYNGSYKIAGGDSVASAPHDVALKVQPNAPIDHETGLPRPTIAIGGDYGLSIVKDNNSIVLVNATNAAYQYVHHVDFDYDGKVVFSFAQANETSRSFRVITIPQANIVIDHLAQDDTDEMYGTYAYTTQHLNLPRAFDGFNDSNSGIVAANGQRIIHSPIGLINISPDTENPEKGMINYITDKYNTGWMPGDCRVVSLCETTSEDIVSQQLVENGSFSSTDISMWNVGANMTASVVSNQLVVSISGAAGYGNTFYAIPGVKAGRIYTLTVDVVSRTEGTFSYGYVSKGGSTCNPTFLSYYFSTNEWISGRTNPGTAPVGTHTLTFRAESDGYLYFAARLYQNASITLDNLSLREAIPDLSFERGSAQTGNGLTAYGVINRTPVGQNSDLVSYNGFSANNYLEQPNNSQLNFGTGNFSVMCWIKTTETGTRILMSKSPPSSITAPYFEFQQSGGSMLWVGASGGNEGNWGVINTGDWVHIAYVREGGIGTCYKNGAIVDYTNDSNNYNHSGTDTLRIGKRQDAYAGYFNGEVTLFKISGTAPSHEQIKKIYNEEKQLLGDNVKAVIYGSSEAVTATAFDWDEKVLHAGTSSGRSTFRNLVRVENTTLPVSSAISAVNGMVVED